MPKSNSEIDKLDRAWCYYSKINRALTGLFEILTINFSKDDIFYQCGVDNLEKLKETILDLLQNDYNPAEIKRKLRDLEFDMKKSLFFSRDSESKKDKEGKREGIIQ